MRNPAKYKKIELYTIRSLQVLSALNALAGFILFFGSVGAYDHAAITFGKFITYGAIGLCFAVAGVLAFNFFGKLKMIKMIDLFGNEVEPVEIPNSKKTKTMQEMYGTIDGLTCKTCKHLYYRQQSRKWYKCEIWDDYFRGRSEASDIRLKNQACGKYEKGGE